MEDEWNLKKNNNAEGLEILNFVVSDVDSLIKI